MLCLPDFNRPYLIESLTSPILIKHCWMFSGPLCDFLLSPLQYLEETTGPAYKVRSNNFDFWIPSSWSVLATDRETYQLDTVDMQACATVVHEAVCFVPEEMKLTTSKIHIIDYVDEINIVHPMISRGMSLVHPIGPNLNNPKVHLSIVIGPNDLYKNLEGKLVGDLFS